MSIEELIKKQREINKEAAFKVPVMIGGTLHEIVVNKVNGREITRIKGMAKCKPDPDNFRHQGLGYNPEEMAIEVVKKAGELYLNGEAIEMDANMWEAVFDVIDANHIENIGATIWHDHYYQPIQDIEEAKKALATHSPGGGSKN